MDQPSQKEVPAVRDEPRTSADAASGSQVASDGRDSVGDPEPDRASTEEGRSDRQPKGDRDIPGRLTAVSALVLVGIVLTTVTALAQGFDLAAGWLYVVATIVGVLVATVLGVHEATKGQSRKRRVRVAVTVCAVTCLLLGAFWVLRPTVERVVEAMTGDLNIAVAEFGTETDDDELRQAASGLSESLYGFLVDESDAFRSENSDVQVRPPASVGAIDGADRAARAESARQLAEEINADVVLYATLGRRSDGGIVTVLEPEFVLNGDRIRDAPELTGHHALGTPVEAPGDPSDAQRSLRGQTQVRVVALAEFMIGLSYYRVDDYDAAFRYFANAVDTPEWRDEDGKELVYLFLGNAESRRRRYGEAQVRYEQALAINPDFARAHIGLAELDFLRSAVVKPDGTDRAGTCEPGTVDSAGLESARERYAAAAAATDQPEIADVDLKAAYGVGRVELCRYLSGEPTAADAAEADFRLVIDGYVGGREAARSLASESYANLAVLASTNPTGTDEAADVACAVTAFYERAIETAVSTDRAEIFRSNMQPSADLVARSDVDCDEIAEAVG